MLAQSVALDIHRYLDGEPPAENRLAEPHPTRIEDRLRAAEHIDDPEMRTYLDASARLIRQRINTLVDNAVDTRPAWTRHLGEEPADPEQRVIWRRHVAAIAAYRDQYQVTDDYPEHPLGPYPTRGRPGHRAYWIAAASLLALRGTSVEADRSCGRIAADVYRTLGPDEQARIAAEVASRLGPDWLGDLRDPSADADQPVYREHLAAVLVEQGHLQQPYADDARSRTARTATSAPSSRPRPNQRKRPQPQPYQGTTAVPSEAVARTTAPLIRPPQSSEQRPRGPKPM